MQLKLSSERLMLCSPNKALVPQLLAFWQRNAAFFKEWSPAYPPNFFTLEYAQQWTTEQLERIQRGEQIRFWLFHHSDTEQVCLLGEVNYTHIQRGIAQYCYLGYKIDQQLQNQGFITEALRIANPYMFQAQGLHRIEANILPHNAASIRVVEKLGFQYEGIAHKLLKINGEWQDHHRYALVNMLMG